MATVTPRYEEEETTLAAPIGESTAAAFQRSGWSAGTRNDLREHEQLFADWSQAWHSGSMARARDSARGGANPRISTRSFALEEQGRKRRESLAAAEEGRTQSSLQV